VKKLSERVREKCQHLENKYTNIRNCQLVSVLDFRTIGVELSREQILHNAKESWRQCKRAPIPRKGSGDSGSTIISAKVATTSLPRTQPSFCPLIYAG